jgi:hypothetical protein
LRLELKIQRVRKHGAAFKIAGYVSLTEILDKPIATVFNKTDREPLFELKRIYHNGYFDFDFDEHTFAITHEYVFKMSSTDGFNDVKMRRELLDDLKVQLSNIMRQIRLELVSGIHPSETPEERIRKIVTGEDIFC